MDIGLQEIPTEVLETYSRALGLGPDDEVPESLIALYKEFKYMKDVIGNGTVTPSELVMLVMYDRRSHKKGDEVAEVILFEKDDRVETIVNGETVMGTFLHYFDDEKVCAVKVDDDPAGFQDVKVADTKRK